MGTVHVCSLDTGSKAEAVDILLVQCPVSHYLLTGKGKAGTRLQRGEASRELGTVMSEESTPKPYPRIMLDGHQDEDLKSAGEQFDEQDM